MYNVKNLGIRQRIEEREEMLSPHAVKSRNSRGRLRSETYCPVRTVFQQDRDRIIHSKSFRRLKHKTQVFVAPSGDHYVTRLTHTLEVSQIGRTISRALNLNEDLTEAIALGHDLGHTPFGHTGEAVLNDLNPDGFRHNEQSLRVVDFLENDGRGLNLTFEVREGILKHSKSGTVLLGEDWVNDGNLEGQVVKIADIIAFVNHDLDDAMRAGLLSVKELPSSILSLLGNTRSERINSMIIDVIECSWGVSGMCSEDKIAITMSDKIREATEMLREFLFDRVYRASSIMEENNKAGQVINYMYGYLMKHHSLLPEEYSLRQEPIERQVSDYIAGMTDQYALQLSRQICFP